MDPEANKWQCLMCEYVYDPAVGDTSQNVSPGVAFEELSDEWMCPECGATKDNFERILEL